MNEAILLLRLALAAILVAHASQKTLGWFQGNGLARQAEIFESLGLVPGRVFVLTASTAEVVAAISLIFGFLSPVGAAIAAGTMAVAGLTMQLGAGRFWNSAGGGEYPYLLALVAVAIGFAGPGVYSIDHLIASAWPWYEVAGEGAWWIGLVIAVLAALNVLTFSRVIARAKAAR